MNWFLHLIGANPAVQAQVHREVDDVIGEDVNRQLTFDDLSRLTYLEACIKETLRLYPSVPIFARQVTEDVTISKG